MRPSGLFLREMISIKTQLGAITLRIASIRSLFQLLSSQIKKELELLIDPG